VVLAAIGIGCLGGCQFASTPPPRSSSPRPSHSGAQVRSSSFTRYVPHALPRGYRTYSAGVVTGVGRDPSQFDIDYVFGTNTPPDPEAFPVHEWASVEADAAGVPYDPPANCGIEQPFAPTDGQVPPAWPCRQVGSMPGGASIWLQSSRNSNDVYLVTCQGTTHVVLSFTTDPGASAPSRVYTSCSP